MNLLNEIVGELRGMFVGDRLLAIGIVAIVAAAALLADVAGAGPLAAGGVLLLGSPILLIGNVCRAAARARPRPENRARRVPAPG